MEKGRLDMWKTCSKKIEALTKVMSVGDGDKSLPEATKRRALAKFRPTCDGFLGVGKSGVN